MERVQINTEVFVYQDVNELPSEERQLIERAKEATKTSYSPYSHFRVGAAVLLENGEIIEGSNQENSAFPSGLCAERVALFYANAKYPDVPVKAMAIAAYFQGDFTEKITAPCGACRQVMYETEIRFNKPLKVILYSKSKILVINSVKELLPLSFEGDHLKK